MIDSTLLTRTDDNSMIKGVPGAFILHPLTDAMLLVNNIVMLLWNERHKIYR